MKKRARRKSPADLPVAKELTLFIENDGTLYRQQYRPIVINLAKKRVNNLYRRALALKLVRYLVENGIKRYKREVADLTFPINAATKQRAAIDLLDGMQDEIRDEVKKLKSAKRVKPKSKVSRKLAKKRKTSKRRAKTHKRRT